MMIEKVENEVKMEREIERGGLKEIEIKMRNEEEMEEISEVENEVKEEIVGEGKIINEKKYEEDEKEG